MKYRAGARLNGGIIRLWSWPRNSPALYEYNGLSPVFWIMKSWLRLVLLSIVPKFRMGLGQPIFSFSQTDTRDKT